MALWERLDPPEYVAVHQRAWDRNYLVWRMHRAGFTLKEIGLRFGRSQERIRQMEARYLRVRHLPAPVEEWLAGWRDEIGRQFGWRPRVKPVRLDIPELIRRANDVFDRAERRKRELAARLEETAEYEARKAAELAEILRRSEERRREIFMEEAEAQAEAFAGFGELQEAAIDEPVTVKEMLLCACAMAVLGSFNFRADDKDYVRQLLSYWSHIARGVERKWSVPACYHRIMAFSLLCDANEALRELVGAEKGGEGVGVPILRDEVLAIMAAMPVALREPTDPDNRITPLKCDEDKTMQLARLYLEIGGSA